MKIFDALKIAFKKSKENLDERTWLKSATVTRPVESSEASLTVYSDGLIETKGKLFIFDIVSEDWEIKDNG